MYVLYASTRDFLCFFLSPVAAAFTVFAVFLLAAAFAIVNCGECN